MTQPWKLLVYIAADNTLYDDAQVSLREITSASLFSDVETIVQIDGPVAQMASRYKCHQGTKELIWEAPDKYTEDRRVRLDEFLTDAAKTSEKEKRIFLVLWGHGAGLDHVYFYKNDAGNGAGNQAGAQNAAPPAPAAAGLSAVVTEAVPAAVAVDAPAVASPHVTFTPAEMLNSDNANRYVNDTSLADVLDNFYKTRGRKIDLLGFDACMMAMVEIWHQLRNSTALAVASDEEVPKGSWPYALILSDLAKFPGMDAHTLSTVVVSRFIEKYSAQHLKTRVALAAFNLAACDALATAVTALVDELLPLVSIGVARRRVFRARDASRTPDEITYIDLGTFCKELCGSFEVKDKVHKAAKEILQVLTHHPYVIYHRDAGESEGIDSYGVAVYFPDLLTSTTQQVNDFTDGQRASGTRPDGGFFLTGGKFPPSGAKFPPSGRKFPPSGRKGLGAVQGEDNPIVGYEILWDHYEQLEFSKTTGWASLIHQLLHAGY